MTSSFGAKLESVRLLVLGSNSETNQRMNHNHLLIVVLEADEIQSTCLHDKMCKLLKLLCTFKHHLRLLTILIFDQLI